MVELARLGPALRLLRGYRRLQQQEMARRAGITRAMALAYAPAEYRPGDSPQRQVRLDQGAG